MAERAPSLARSSRLREIVARSSRRCARARASRSTPRLVRGMGYYTGPIFEIAVEGSPGSLAGGGRYDR